MKRYRLTPAAALDLAEITDFIAADRPRAADRLIDSLEQKCQALADMPGIGRSREDLAPNLRTRYLPERHGSVIVIHLFFKRYCVYISVDRS